MAAPTKPTGAGWLALLMLAACSSPPTSNAAREKPASARLADVASAPAAEPAPSSAQTASSARVDPSQLPEDVRDFILKQRMCRHFSRAEAEGGNPAMAASTCAGADETAWKALVRKYRDDDAIASVLLAERPAAAAERQ